MNIVIPMAGMGKRLRPHTLNLPKPLVKIAGKSIVEWLVEDIIKIVDDKVENIGFVVGNFGKEVEDKLLNLASSLGAKGHIFYQDEPLGTGHAIYCASDILDGKVIVAFADTLFNADFKLDRNVDGTIWVKEVEDPSAFGVVKLDENNIITDFVEKPKDYVSNKAIIGIYYFKDGKNFNNELKYLIDNDIRRSGEYQLTTALENMKSKGLKFNPGVVDLWLDFGNKEACIDSLVDLFTYKNFTIGDTVEVKNSVVIEPCYIGKNVKLINSVVGPNVSIDENSEIKNSVVSTSIIGNDNKIENIRANRSMTGENVNIKGKSLALSIGSFSEHIENND